MKALLQRIFRAEVIVLMISGLIAYGLLKWFHLEQQETLHPLFPWVIKLVPLTFFASAGYSLLWEIQELDPKKWLFKLPRYSLEVLAALGFGALVHQVHPPLFIDDAGFILRYLDHFAEGYFYTFNPADGPAFGISSFSFGIITGFLSWTHLFTPENSLIVTNYAGLFATGFFLFRILGQTQLKPYFLPLVWLLVMGGSKAYLLMCNTGMETTLVSASVCAAIYFFLKERSGWMWGMLALTAISKLDMVPLVVVVAVFYFLFNWKAFFPISVKNKALRHLVLAGITPVVLYILFAWIVFGSPLPLSAHSKMFHHIHLEGFFPWFDYFHKTPFHTGVLLAMLFFFVGHHVIALEQRKTEVLKLTVFGWAFAGVSLLYYIYNPGERMMWYYALPDFLLLIQLGVSGVVVFQRLDKVAGLTLFSLTMIGFLLVNGNRMLGEVSYYEKMTGRVEKERAKIGDAIGQVTTEQDSIASGHGLISRKSNAYVIDMVGLNNALATKYELDLTRVVKELRPKWVIMHAYYDVVSLMEQQGYRLNQTFYDIALNWYPAFRLYERIETPGVHEWVRPVHKDRVSADREVKQISSILHARGLEIELRAANRDSLAQILLFGVQLTAEEQLFDMLVYSGDSLMGQISTGVGAKVETGGDTEEVRWDLPVYLDSLPLTKVRVLPEKEMRILDPVLITSEDYESPMERVEPVELDSSATSPF